MLSHGQSLSLDAALNCHNIVLIGPGGGNSGKIFVLNKVYRKLGLRGRNVFITCSTGIAAHNMIKIKPWDFYKLSCTVSQGGIALNLDVFFDPIPHILSLESIFRQNEPDLISCVYDDV